MEKVFVFKWTEEHSALGLAYDQTFESFSGHGHIHELDIYETEIS